MMRKSAPLLLFVPVAYEALQLLLPVLAAYEALQLLLLLALMI